MVVAAVAVPFLVTAWRLPVSSNDEYMMWALRGRMLAAGHLDPLVFGGAANPSPTSPGSIRSACRRCSPGSSGG